MPVRGELAAEDRRTHVELAAVELAVRGRRHALESRRGPHRRWEVRWDRDPGAAAREGQSQNTSRTSHEAPHIARL